MGAAQDTDRQTVTAAERWRGDVTREAEDALRQQLVFVYGTGLAFGLELGLFQYLFGSAGALVSFIAGTLVFSTVTLALWRWILPRFSSLPRSRRLAAQWAICSATFTVLSALVTEGHALIAGGSSILHPYRGSDLTLMISATALRWAPVAYTVIPIVPASLICIVGFNHHWWRIRLLQGRERELRELAVAAQLAALRAQLNPHFFFNCLNSIAQLISTEPAKAEACVEQLAEIFRYMLRSGQSELVPLEEELRIAEAYLEIERARFGEDLTVEQRVEARARQVLLPELILQPLVENAVKHGISRKVGGGRLLIEAVLDNGDLRLTIDDTGEGVQNCDAMFTSGLGLKNVRDRLLRLYGPAYAPVVHSTPGQGTTVTLRIPLPLATEATLRSV